MPLAYINPDDSEKAARLLQSLIRSLNAWRDRQSRSPERVQPQFNEAISTVQSALRETNRYQRGLREGRRRDAEVEDRLSELWGRASDAIRPYDTNLAGLCMVKGQGWADPAIWDHPDYTNLPILAEDILAKLMKVVLPVPRWFRDETKEFAAAIFTLLSLVSLFYLIIRPEDISPGKRVVLDVWVAFCIAASVSFIGGTAHAMGRLPWLGDAPIKFLAVGGVGVFVVILVLLYGIYH